MTQPKPTPLPSGTQPANPPPGVAASSLTPAYGWNPFAGRYVERKTGLFVPFQEVRAELERLVEHAATSVRDLTAQLRARQISLAEWQLGMGREMKLLHAASAAAGRGGWAQMTGSDWGWVGAQLRAQYTYLARFARQIESGTQKLDGRLLVRAEQYARAARTTYEQMRLRTEHLVGKKTQGRRILHARESCAGCIAEAARGWVAIETMAPIGVFECRHNCRCSLEFR